MHDPRTDHSGQEEPPLRRVAKDPEAFAQYLADVQRWLLSIGANLEQLHRETRVHCRGRHVEGDRWYHARLRARPVEQALKDALGHITALTDDLEKTTHKRRAHEEEMNSLPRQRKEKALARQRKRNARRPIPIESRERSETDTGKTRYSEPTSIYDLGRRESA